MSYGCCWKVIWLGALVLCYFRPARATSVVAPSFPELVRESQIIVRAKVKYVKCAWVDSSQGRAIKTFVTLTIHRCLKGSAPPEMDLQLLGGEIDGQSMRVEGMPRFVAGQTEILFISENGVRFCPLVAMMHGRYRVLTDEQTAREYVARDDRVPLESEHDVQLPQRVGPLVSSFKRAPEALTPESFEQRIIAEIGQHAVR